MRARTARPAMTMAIVLGSFSVAACAALTDRRGPPRWEDVSPPAPPPPPAEVTFASTAPSSGPAPTPPPPAVPPAPASEGAGPIDVDGRPVDDGALLDMPGLELACLPAADALTAPLAARARYDESAGRLGLPVGRLVFVVLVRDPARSITDPPPHLCRAIPTAAALKAPFVRVREPGARWLFRRIASSLVDDARALVEATAAKHLSPVARPRVLLDESGGLLAVALPVEGGELPPTDGDAHGGT